MLLRCPRCQALFSVQDGIAPAGVSFQVECGRCRVTFHTPGASQAAAEPPEPSGASPASAVQMPRVRPAPPRLPPPVLERKTTAGDLARALRARRPEPAVLDMQRRLYPRRITPVHAAWIGGGLAAVLVVALLLRLAFAGPPREVQQRMLQGRELLFRDDEKSVSRAAGLFAEAAVLANGKWGTWGDRATALFLVAASHRDLAFRLATAERGMEDAQVRLEEDESDGWEEEDVRLTEARAALRLERDAHLNEAARLLREGLAAAKTALEHDPEDAAGLRAMALQVAFVDGAEDGARFADRASRKEPRDPWIAYARAALLLAGRPGRERQEQAAAALAAVRGAEPRLLRASVDAAALAMDRGDAGAAREGFTAVLRDNPGHERAQRLLALLPAPVPAPP